MQEFDSVLDRDWLVFDIDPRSDIFPDIVFYLL